MDGACAAAARSRFDALLAWGVLASDALNKLQLVQHASTELAALGWPVCPTVMTCRLSLRNFNASESKAQATT